LNIDSGNHTFYVEIQKRANDVIRIWFHPNPFTAQAPALFGCPAFPERWRTSIAVDDHFLRNFGCQFSSTIGRSSMKRTVWPAQSKILQVVNPCYTADNNYKHGTSFNPK